MEEKIENASLGFRADGVLESANIENSDVPEQEVAEKEAETVKPQISEAQKMTEFLINPENRKQAVNLAAQIESCVGKNWFTLSRLVKKSSENRISAYQKLNICKMFGLVKEKVETVKENGSWSKMVQFKVTIDSVDKVLAINDVIAYHQREIEKLESERRSLQGV